MNLQAGMCSSFVMRSVLIEGMTAAAIAVGATKAMSPFAPSIRMRLLR